MKKLVLVAAAVLVAGAASAQGPTRQTTPAFRAVAAPAAPSGPNNLGPGTSAGSFAPSASSYSQDSYIEQSNSGNYSRVVQTDSRSGARVANSGSSAEIVQTGYNNNAFQTQTLNASSNEAASSSLGAGTSRNFLSSTQRGEASQTDQTQVGGYANAARVTQGYGTGGDRAIQTQTGGRNNRASITQSYSGGPDDGTVNRAEQTQSVDGNTAQIEQQGRASYASQTQEGVVNDASILQGARSERNTALQNQVGYLNKARIRQSAGLSPANDNYARQDQSGTSNQADIEQNSSGNYARQMQAGFGAQNADNRSTITQNNVSSAAYTTQTGSFNRAVVTQQ